MRSSKDINTPPQRGKTAIYRYGRGFLPHHIIHASVAPSITTSAYPDNNMIILYETNTPKHRQ